MRPFALALLLVALAACPPGGGADSGDTASDTGTASPFGPGAALDACSPDDGSAVELQLGLSSASCDATMGAGPFLTLVVWNHAAPLAPGTYALTASDDGMARYDADGTGAADGASATGSVTITSWSAGSIVGRFDVALGDGTPLAGDFDVPWCDVDVLCG